MSNKIGKSIIFLVPIFLIIYSWDGHGSTQITSGLISWWILYLMWFLFWRGDEISWKVLAIWLLILIVFLSIDWTSISGGSGLEYMPIPPGPLDYPDY
jgi:hypothetical protein